MNEPWRFIRPVGHLVSLVSVEVLNYITSIYAMHGVLPGRGPEILSFATVVTDFFGALAISAPARSLWKIGTAVAFVSGATVDVYLTFMSLYRAQMTLLPADALYRTTVVGGHSLVVVNSTLLAILIFGMHFGMASSLAALIRGVSYEEETANEGERRGHLPVAASGTTADSPGLPPLSGTADGGPSTVPSPKKRRTTAADIAGKLLPIGGGTG